jgi:hypothetical protein
MIKIITGYSGPGGSTVVFNTLTNLFNENNIDTCLYGPTKWDGINCKFKITKDVGNITKDDILIYHFCILPKTNARKTILSCHETTLFKISQIKNLVYDKIHFVSEFQKNWQDVDGIVIPNPVRQFSARTNDGTKKVVGIIGSIDSNKRVHLSIQKALKDGFNDIRLYGHIGDFAYFKQYVEPLLSKKVKMFGVVSNMDYVYNQLTHVYHSPELETYNLIKQECKAAGVIYVGEEGNNTKAEVWSNDKILNAWKTLL